MRNVLLIHYTEIGTKGKNRSFFERRLRDEIARRLPKGQVFRVRVDSGRLLADLAEGYSTERIGSSLDQVFGVAWYAFAEAVPKEWPAIEEAGLRCAAAFPDAKTFKVFCRRADKTFALSSQTICDRLGQAIVDKYKLKVDLDHHDLAVNVEILPDAACVYAEKRSGRRGLPTGSSGRMLCLFSGGIDSPVAAWLLMRRGAAVHLLHFHPHRRAEELAGSKILALHRALQSYDPASRLYLIPHYPYQVKAALEIPAAYEMILFRKFMFRVGEALAREKGFKALITGDSLGQVASQTVENIAAAQDGLAMPLFTPLISYDKDDIVRLARQVGTYELSIQPYKDCCSLMSRHPKTMISLERARDLETRLRLPELIEEALPLIEIWDGEKFAAARPVGRAFSPAQPSPTGR